MIKFILNIFPRAFLQRLAGRVVPIAGIFYAGRGVECPICGARYRRFMPYGYVEVRKNALCPRCLSLERHRLLWLWLERESGMAGRIAASRFDKLTATRNDDSRLDTPNFLHIAPEVCLSKKFEAIFGNPSGVSRVGQKRDRSEYDTHTSPQNVLRSYETRSSDLNDTTTKPLESYVTGDLESPLAKVKMDVQRIPFPDGSFDVVMCNHVLEHVANDRLAMRELRRVTRTGGWGVMLSPVDEGRAETFEDDSMTDPSERTKIFGQYDHRRIYGRDYADRLRDAGWSVEKIDYYAILSPAERKKYALRSEILYIVRK